MTILAVDVGFGYLKTSTGLLVESRITEEPQIIPHTKTLQINGHTYYIGVGKDSMEICRVNEEILMILLIYGILNSTNDQVVNLVTGLPINQVKDHANSLRNRILTECASVRCTCNGKERFLSVRNCEVYPQGLASVIDYNGSVIVIDLGTRTTNILYLRSQNGHRRVVSADTLYDGMASLYSKLTSAINQHYSLTLTPEEIPDKLQNGLFVDGEECSLSFTVPIIKTHVSTIADAVKLSMPYRTTPVQLIGGGAISLGSQFRKIFPKAEYTEYTQFANVQGMLRRGQQLWATSAI